MLGAPLKWINPHPWPVFNWIGEAALNFFPENAKFWSQHLSLTQVLTKDGITRQVKVYKFLFRAISRYPQTTY